MCAPCAGDRCARPGVRHSCGTAWRACEHAAPPDLRSRDETVLVLVDTDEDLYEMMQLALEVRPGARHVHARVVQRRREGRHLREVALGQVVAVLLEAAGDGACRLHPVDGHYVFAKQHLWLTVVPLASIVSRRSSTPPGAGHRPGAGLEDERTALKSLKQSSSSVRIFSPGESCFAFQILSRSV